MTRALVLGGGLTGVLAAVALARHFDTVTIVEGDVYPDSPSPRKGVPQAKQNHMLMGGGADAFDQLLPGTTDLLYEAGAHKLSMADRILTLSAEGWFGRSTSDAYLVACTRPLIDHVIRQQAFRDPVIEVLQSTKVVGLLGDAAKVTGARIEGASGEQSITADFVVDATGTRSKAPEWLVALGLPQVEESYLDAGLAYAGRMFEAPADAVKDFPGVLIQPRPTSGGPGAGAAFMPQEDGKWIISMIGTRGGQPPSTDEGFLEFARALRHPIAAQLIEAARPISEIRGSRGLANKLRHYDKYPMPDGFVSMGDSAMVLSPNYATGMSLAAIGALALRARLKSIGVQPGLSKKVQADVAAAGKGPWRSAIGSDRWFPGVETNIKLPSGTQEQKMAAKFSKTAASNPAVLSAVYDVASLRKPQSAMMSLPVLFSVLRGPKKAPLSAAEAIAQFPEVGALLGKAPAESVPLET